MNSVKRFPNRFKWTWNPIRAYRQWKQDEKTLKDHEVAGPIYDNYLRSTNTCIVYYTLGMLLLLGISLFVMFGLGVSIE